MSYMKLERIDIDGIPAGLAGSILCSTDSGIPSPCTMLWLSLMRQRYSEKHLRNHLRAISKFYEHSAVYRKKDDLDTLLIVWKFDEIEKLSSANMSMPS